MTSYMVCKGRAEGICTIVQGKRGRPKGCGDSWHKIRLYIHTLSSLRYNAMQIGPQEFRSQEIMQFDQLISPQGLRAHERLLIAFSIPRCRSKSHRKVRINSRQHLFEHFDVHRAYYVMLYYLLSSASTVRRLWLLTISLVEYILLNVQRALTMSPLRTCVKVLLKGCNSACFEETTVSLSHTNIMCRVLLVSGKHQLMTRIF